MTTTEPAVAPRTAASRVGHAHTALVVDDEPRIRGVVIRALQLDGITADGAPDASAALAMLARRPYDLVILDLLMPGRDGFTALGDILRIKPDQAVLVLSCLSDAPAKIRSLDLGADDYLVKPFHVDELLARVRARLRALHRHSHSTLRHGRLTLDLVRHRVSVDGRAVQLTDREFQLLSELLNHPGQVVTKKHLLAHVWGYDPGDSSNVIDVCVRRLRARLGDEMIETVRGKGYRACC